MIHALLEGVAGAAIVLATLFLVYGIFKATDGRKQKETSMAQPQPMQLNAITHAHLVWLAGLRAGRESVHLCETLEEAEARSPYLVDGQDPVEISLEWFAEKEN